MHDVEPKGMANNYSDIFKSLAWRTIFALPFFAVALSCKLPFLSPFLIVAGAIILAFPLARLFAEPAGSLFYPGKRLSRAQPMFSIPESKRAKGLYEEAITGFEKIAEDYPDETKPYIEMIDIAIRDLKDPERASRMYHHGLSVLKKDRDRAVLSTMYNAIRTRLNSTPSN